MRPYYDLEQEIKELSLMFSRESQEKSPLPRQSIFKLRSFLRKIRELKKESRKEKR